MSLGFMVDKLLIILQSVAQTLIPVFLMALRLVLRCGFKLQFQCGTKVGTDVPKSHLEMEALDTCRRQVCILLFYLCSLGFGACSRPH